MIAKLVDSLKFDSKNSDIGETNSAGEIYSNLRGCIKKSQINEDHKNCSQSESAHILVEEIKNLKCFVDNRIGNRKDLMLSDDVFLKSVNLMDLVSVDSTRTSCFTKKLTLLT